MSCDKCNNLNYSRVLHKAIKRYGITPQMDVCIEELAELIKALVKYKRVCRELYKEDSPDVNAAIEAICEEYVDVSIMLDQLLIMFPEIELREREIRDAKIARLAGRLFTIGHETA